MRPTSIGFLKREIAASKSQSIGSELLDRAFKIPLKSFTLIRAEPYSGATALVLEIAAHFSNQGHYVIVADVGGSLYPNRLWGINKDYLAAFRPTNARDILKVVQGLKNEGVDAILILDMARYITDGWSLDKKLEHFVLGLRELHPGITIICTQRKGYIGRIWSCVIDIKILKYLYDDTGTETAIGHLLRVEGPEGYTTVLVEYYTGRLSPAYEYAALEVEKGVSKNSIFKYKDVEVQGFWKFVFEYSKRLKDVENSRTESTAD